MRTSRDVIKFFTEANVHYFSVLLISMTWHVLEALCWRRLQTDPARRFHVTQRDDLEPVGGLGIAAAKGGSVKSRRLGQICVGANTRTVKLVHEWPTVGADSKLTQPADFM